MARQSVQALVIDKFSRVCIIVQCKTFRNFIHVAAKGNPYVGKVRLMYVESDVMYTSTYLEVGI